MKRVVFLSLIFFSLSIFGQKVDKKQVDLKAEEQAIRAISMKWLELAKSHNSAGIAALFADEGTEYNENQEPSVGPAAILRSITQDLKENPKEVVNWTTDRVDIATSIDLAVEYGSYNSMGLGLNGTGTDHGKYVTVYRKINGTWKVVADITNSTQPKGSSK
jgi:uncharacterized protein (TIGR02246 family)